MCCRPRSRVRWCAVAVSPEGEAEFLQAAAELGLALQPIGQLTPRQAFAVELR